MSISTYVESPITDQIDFLEKLAKKLKLTHWESKLYKDILVSLQRARVQADKEMIKLAQDVAMMGYATPEKLRLVRRLVREFFDKKKIPCVRRKGEIRAELLHITDHFSEVKVPPSVVAQELEDVDLTETE